MVLLQLIIYLFIYDGAVSLGQVLIGHTMIAPKNSSMLCILVLASNFVTSHISLPNFLGPPSPLFNHKPIRQLFLINLISLIPDYILSFNQAWHLAVSPWLSTLHCLKINQYLTGLFVGYSVKT
jgi:hypothetical protein